MWATMTKDSKYAPQRRWSKLISGLRVGRIQINTRGQEGTLCGFTSRQPASLISGHYAQKQEIDDLSEKKESSHRMRPLALMDRITSQLIGWQALPNSVDGESQLIGTRNDEEMIEKIVQIQGKIKDGLGVSPWNGVVRFGRKERLATNDMWDHLKSWSVLDRLVIGMMLPQELRCVPGPVSCPIEIVERDVKKLKRRRIPLVKVRWNSRQGAEYTWEREDQFRKKYPNLFSEPVPSSGVAT
ncbi:hypothetical protein Tco_0524480 [Tanacetum coccineum]